MLGVETCSGISELSHWYRTRHGQSWCDVPGYLRSSTAFSSLSHLVSQDSLAELERVKDEFGPDIYLACVTALMAGHAVKGTTSPNPPVGACVLTGAKDSESSSNPRAFVGATQPPGNAHAEVMALRAAGENSRGGIAVVTLEPCNHTGRTGPCAEALVRAGITQVFYMASDPNPQASGGAEYLRSYGVEVHKLGIEPLALAPWLRGITEDRVAITAKWAHTLDGFIAATDGSSKWITGEKAREYVHHDRSRRDAIVVGTGTALTDNPQLSARTDDGVYDRQPIRVVIGTRPLPSDSHLGQSLVEPSELRLGTGQVIQCETIEQALSILWAAGARDVIVEGGSGLFASLFESDLVDFIDDYTAPSLLGDGVPLLAGPLAHTMTDIVRFSPLRIAQLGDDVLWQLARDIKR